MRDRKKPEEPQEEGAPAWMNTYGDMITLILTFFVLLFSFSTIDAEKWEEIVSSFSGIQVIAISAMDPNAAEKLDEDMEGKFTITSSVPAPTATPEPTAAPSPTPAVLPNGMNVEEARKGFNELYEKIKEYVETNGLGSILFVEYIDDYTISLRMSDQAFFDPGKTYLKEASKLAIEGIGNIFMEYIVYIQAIQIEGHTDNVPIHNAKFADNWDLSYGRANTVREFLMSITDLDPMGPPLVTVIAFGEYQPVASNDTAEGRAQNRRVDFVIESILKG